MTNLAMPAELNGKMGVRFGPPFVQESDIDKRKTSQIFDGHGATRVSKG